MKTILLATAFAVAQIATSLPAAAGGSKSANNSSDEFAEIIVTAERRFADLKTPIAATVLPGTT
jgi:hypothetical protein